MRHRCELENTSDAVVVGATGDGSSEDRKRVGEVRGGGEGEDPHADTDGGGGATVQT